MAKFCPIQILGPHPNGKNATGHHLYLFTDMHIKILIRSIMRIRLHRRFTIPVNIQIFLFFVTSGLCKCWEMMVQITIWMQLIYSSPCITLMGRILWNPELVSGIAVSVMLLCEGSNSS